MVSASPSHQAIENCFRFALAAKDISGIFSADNQKVGTGSERLETRPGLIDTPQLRPVVDVQRERDTRPAGARRKLLAQLPARRGEGRGDARDVNEPGLGHHRPGKIAGRHLRRRAISTVVNRRDAPRRRGQFRVENSEASVRDPTNMTYVHTVAG